MTFENPFYHIKENPVIIAGPCSAESKEQVLQTALEIKKDSRITVFRAGIWKPRTRPGNFEGVGKIGLSWLKEAKQITGLKLAVEVAKPHHVELALANDVDYLWIGARTVVNPFSVQEISEAVKGVKTTIFVKNPMTPDLGLWIGALERFNSVGIHNLAAVHRGFYQYKHDRYRNVPMWEIPIELKRNYPQLPIICDPSHIAGNRTLLLEISQKAMDLAMNGLMIETHINPDVALTDHFQQITPNTLSQLLDTLVYKRTDIQEKNNFLQLLRNEIDELDEQIIELLAKRMLKSNQIGQYKKENQITIFQLNRWKEVLNSRADIAEKKKLSKEFIATLFKLIHKESIRKQSE